MKKKEKYKDREEQFEDATAEVEAYHSGINASAQVCFFYYYFSFKVVLGPLLRRQNIGNLTIKVV